MLKLRRRRLVLALALGLAGVALIAAAAAVNHPSQPAPVVVRHPVTVTVAETKSMLEPLPVTAGGVEARVEAKLWLRVRGRLYDPVDPGLVRLLLAALGPDMAEAIASEAPPEKLQLPGVDKATPYLVVSASGNLTAYPAANVTLTLAAGNETVDPRALVEAVLAGEEPPPAPRAETAVLELRAWFTVSQPGRLEALLLGDAVAANLTALNITVDAAPATVEAVLTVKGTAAAVASIAVNLARALGQQNPDIITVLASPPAPQLPLTPTTEWGTELANKLAQCPVSHPTSYYPVTANATLAGPFLVVDVDPLYVEAEGLPTTNIITATLAQDDIHLQDTWMVSTCNMLCRVVNVETSNRWWLDEYKASVDAECIAPGPIPAPLNITFNGTTAVAGKLLVVEVEPRTMTLCFTVPTRILEILARSSWSKEVRVSDYTEHATYEVEAHLQVVEAKPWGWGCLEVDPGCPSYPCTINVTAVVTVG